MDTTTEVISKKQVTDALLKANKYMLQMQCTRDPKRKEAILITAMQGAFNDGARAMQEGLLKLVVEHRSKLVDEHKSNE